MKHKQLSDMLEHTSDTKVPKPPVDMTNDAAPASTARNQLPNLASRPDSNVSSDCIIRSAARSIAPRTTKSHPRSHNSRPIQSRTNREWYLTTTQSRLTMTIFNRLLLANPVRGLQSPSVQASLWLYTFSLGTPTSVAASTRLPGLQDTLIKSRPTHKWREEAETLVIQKNINQSLIKREEREEISQHFPTRSVQACQRRSGLLEPKEKASPEELTGVPPTRRGIFDFFL